MSFPTYAQAAPKNELGRGDLQEMVAVLVPLVRTLLPGLTHRTIEAKHPYTIDGLQIDVCRNNTWIEIGECGLARPQILADALPNIPAISGLAMGLGLDRILMLRKGIPDIRLLRTADSRIASQMLDLEPYRAVSHMPSVTRDLSLMVSEDQTAEDIGDCVRQTLGDQSATVEMIEVRSETLYRDLPPQAVARMGALPGQKNVLLRVVLRDLERTLTHSEANQIRDNIYLALHMGQRKELASS